MLQEFGKGQRFQWAKRVVLSWELFCAPRGHLVMSENFQNRGGAAELRQAAKHPTLHRTDIHNKDIYLVQTINSVTTEKS